jgi:hypothetical protein
MSTTPKTRRIATSPADTGVGVGGRYQCVLPVRKLTAPKNARDPGDRLTTVDRATPTPTVLSVRFDRSQLALGGIVVAQAIWLWILIGRGWFLQADFSNLADGLSRPLTWTYLREPLGGHFAPVLRLLYWLLDRIGLLDHSLTVAIRVLLQAASTILLYRVLRLLVGRTNLMLTVVGLYAFSPLLLAGLAWLASGLGLVLGQVFALLAIETHLRYGRTRDLRFAVATGVLLALATLSADQWIVVALTLPILSAAYVYQGTTRERLRSFVAHWRAWTLTLVPVGLAAVLAVLLSNTAGVGTVGIPAAYRLVRNEWLRSVGPSFVGGPWTWFGGSETYLPFLAPPDEALLLGQIVFVVLVVIGFQRNRWRSLAGWSLPIVTAISSVLLVGVGRYQASGLLIAITPRYSFQVMAPLAVGVVLALSRSPDAATATDHPNGPRQTERATRLLGLMTALVVAALSLMSAARFVHFWGANPARDYVAALTASARAAGPDVNIYDTPVPPGMISIVEPRHHVSDILHLAQVPARFDDPRSEPLVASSDGHLSRAGFLAAATAAGPPAPNCGSLIRGAGVWTINLSKPVSTQEWFLRIDLYQSAPSVISIEVLNAEGDVAVPVGGARVALSKLEAVNLRLPFFAPSAVRIRSDSPATNLCLVHIRVGGPFAVPGAVR